MAKAFYNQLIGAEDADAAGTSVREVGQTLQERKETSSSKYFFLLDVMDEIGFDLSQAIREPLDHDNLKDYDKVISMALPSQSPQWLLAAPNYVFWDVKDPRGQDFKTTAHIRDDILARVKELIATA